MPPGNDELPSEVMLAGVDLKKYFSVKGGFLQRETAKVHAVDGVTLNIGQGETLALVGESGCGKTTLGRLLLRLIEPTSGDVFYDAPRDPLIDYERALQDSAAAPHQPPALEAFRERYSITWRERVSGSRAFFVRLAVAFAGAILLGLFVPALLTGLGAVDIADGWVLLGYGVLVGALAAIGGTLVLRRPLPRLPEILGGLTFVLVNVGVPLSLGLSVWWFRGPGSTDLGQAYLNAWVNNGGAFFLAVVLGPIVTLVVSRNLLRWTAQGKGKGGRKLRDVRRQMQPVFQDPFTSLDPRMLVKDIISEPILLNRLMSREEAEVRTAALLQEVGLRGDHMYRFPHEFSGGQRQRIAVARALAPNPRFLLLDEPTSALDVSVQAQILNLLKEIQQRQNLTYLLITHNLSVVKQMANRVAVMYLGEIVEQAPTAELFESPLHPYTRALLSAVPVPDPKRKRERIILAGDVPSPVFPPSGCRFHTRCPAVLPTCGWEPTDLSHLAPFLFDSSRNPEAAGLPALSEISAHGNTLSLHFRGATLTEDHRQKVEAIVKEHQAEGKDRIMFQAITAVRLGGASVDLEFHKAKKPPMLDVSPGHRVACFLYPQGIEGQAG